MKKIVEHTAREFIKLFTMVLFTATKLYSKYPHSTFLREVAKFMSKKDYTTTFRIRPKNLISIPYVKYEQVFPEFAIILQGPIRAEDDFTMETVCYYKKMYKNVTVIVSTWIDEKKKDIAKLEELGAVVVCSEKPIYGGHGNRNFQLISSKAGISKARELGIKYVCKSRTDQRIMKPFVFEYMWNLIHTFPAYDKARQKKRIVTLSMVYGNMFFPYLMSDFLYFGTTEDIEKLFSVELDNRPDFKMRSGATRREYVESLEPAEIYILQNYLKEIGIECDSTIKDYWESLKNYFVCIDRKCIDLVWPKYDGQYLTHEFYGDYFLDDSEDGLKTMNFDFANWLNLYSGTLLYKPHYEQMVDKKFR